MSSNSIIWWVLVWLLLLVHVVVPDVVCWCWWVPCHHATHINSTLPHRVHYRVFIFYQLFQSIMLETSIYYSGHTRLPQVCLQLYKQGWVSQVVILSYNFLWLLNSSPRDAIASLVKNFKCHHPNQSTPNHQAPGLWDAIASNTKKLSIWFGLYLNMIGLSNSSICTKRLNFYFYKKYFSSSWLSLNRHHLAEHCGDTFLPTH